MGTKRAGRTRMTQETARKVGSSMRISVAQRQPSDGSKQSRKRETRAILACPCVFWLAQRAKTSTKSDTSRNCLSSSRVIAAAPSSSRPYAVAEGLTAGWGIASLRLSPLTSGLTRGELLYGEFASLRLSPLTSGPKAVAEGRVLDQESASLHLLPPTRTTGLSRKRCWRHLLLNQESASLRLSPRTTSDFGEVLVILKTRASSLEMSGESCQSVLR